MVEEAYTGEDLFFSLFGATGLEGRNRAYAGAGGDPTKIAYSAYTFDPQGNLVQPVTLYPGRSAGAMVRVDTSSAYDGFGWSSTVGAEGQIDPYSPVGFGGQQGYYRDWTGLYLLGHRYYDAGAGRFVTRDPIGYTGGINLYGFAGNNPVNESDPSGFAPPTKGPFGEMINPAQLYTHHPDTHHPNLHYDYKIPGNPKSADPNERGLREYRFDPQNNVWQEKQRSRKPGSARRMAAANLAVNAEERKIGGSMSKVNKTRFLRSVFAQWGQKILKYIPETPPQLEIFNFLPVVEPDSLFWMQRHPHADPGDYDKYGKYEGGA